MTAHNIFFFIDPQNGFGKKDLTKEQGGSLYVPGGEAIGQPVADLLSHLTNATVVLSQDFHPADHISFASNHPGAQPFQDIYLGETIDGRYKAVAADVTATDGDTTVTKICAVETDANGYILRIHEDKVLSAEDVEGTVKQRLWLDHCVQGTESALFLDPIMEALPERLRASLLKQDPRFPVLYGKDNHGNLFCALRKGTQSDVDSYGIAKENDRKSKTFAPTLFEDIADRLQATGVKEANIFIGGLATNFCVEFSHNDIYEYLVPQLEKRGIKPQVYFLSDISAGIPTPDATPGIWPDLTTSTQRMAKFGTQETTTDDFIRANLAGRDVKPAFVAPVT